MGLICPGAYLDFESKMSSRKTFVCFRLLVDNFRSPSRDENSPVWIIQKSTALQLWTHPTSRFFFVETRVGMNWNLVPNFINFHDIRYPAVPIFENFLGTRYPAVLQISKILQNYHTNISGMKLSQEFYFQEIKILRQNFRKRRRRRSSAYGSLSFEPRTVLKWRLQNER